MTNKHVFILDRTNLVEITPVDVLTNMQTGRELEVLGVEIIHSFNATYVRSKIMRTEVSL